VLPSRLEVPPPIDHGSSQTERWLRANRFKLVLALVIIEALLIAFGVLGFWLALVIAACVIVLYLLFARYLSGTAHELAMIAAASQAGGILVFALALAAVVFLVVVVVILALAVLVAIFVPRR
jgi:uncharacterized membrane protein